MYNGGGRADDDGCHVVQIRSWFVRLEPLRDRFVEWLMVDEAGGGERVLGGRWEGLGLIILVNKCGWRFLLYVGYVLYVITSDI